MVALTPDPSFKASLITEKNNRKVFSQCSVRTCLFIKRATFYLVFFPQMLTFMGFFFTLIQKGKKKVVLLCLHFFICFILRFLVFFSLK